MWDSEGVTYPALVDPAWVTTASMIEPRAHHAASLLASGRVLVTGGSDQGVVRQTAELYDPTTGTWASAGLMTDGRADHTSHVLTDGRVLLVGGTGSNGNLSTAEVYNPSTSAFVRVGDLSGPRSLHTGTRLPDGRVLVTGGASSGTNILSTAEIFDHQSNGWVNASSMGAPRVGAQAISLAGGNVLMAGGRTSYGANGCVGTAEIFSPSTNSWTPTASMARPRCDYSARALSDGTVIVATGFSDAGTMTPVDSVELFNPTSGAWRTSMAKVPAPSRGAAAALLPSGSMLLTGGFGPTSQPLASASMYQLDTSSSWQDVPSMASPRASHTATVLGPQSVLVVGGEDLAGQSVSSAELRSLTPEGQSEGAGRDRALEMAWQDPVMVRPMNSAPVGILIRNKEPRAFTGTLRVVAWTPDGRRVERDARTITIPACRDASGAPCPTTLLGPSTSEEAAATETTATLAYGESLQQLSTNDIPVQPVSHQGQLRVEFIPQGVAPGTFNPSTSNVWYQFSSNYGYVQFNGELGSDSLTPERTYNSPEEYSAQLTARFGALEQPIAGRLRTPSNTWADMADEVPHDVDFEVFGGVRLGGALNFDLPVFGPREDLFDWLYPPKQLDWRFVPTDLTGFRKVCTSFKTDFRDGRRGETYEADIVPAAYMRATLFSDKITAITTDGKIIRPTIWSGYLDVNGCTENINFESGNFTLVVKSEMQRAHDTGWTLFEIEEKKGARPRQKVSWALSFGTRVLTVPGARPSLDLEIPPGLAGNDGAVAAQIHRTQEEALARVTYKVFVSDDPLDCNNTGAYANAETGIHICPNAGSNPGPNNAKFKFIIAHEFGHHVEQKGGGTIPGPLSSPYTSMDQGLAALCTCAHVFPQDSALHCLQSQEVYATGSKEGFGQFFATRVWNDPAAAAPRFQYYKQFKEPNNAVVAAGSKSINVRQTPIRWSDTHCSLKADGRSTEYDFLGFYWAINTAPTNERTSLPELYNIMKHVNANPADRLHNGSWTVYRDAAAATFGPMSPKFDKFRTSGPAFGVDH